MKVTFLKALIISGLMILVLYINEKYQNVLNYIPITIIFYIVGSIFFIDFKLNFKLNLYEQFRKISAYLLLSIIGFYLVSISISLIPQNLISSSRLATNNVNYDLYAISVILFFSPVAEELFFRGFLAERISQSYNDKIGLLFSSFIFTIAHFYSGGLLIALLGGLFLGYIYLATRSIAICIITHVLINFLTMFNSNNVVFLMKKNNNDFNLIILFLILIIGTFLCVFFLKKIRMRTMPR